MVNLNRTLLATLVLVASSVMMLIFARTRGHNERPEDARRLLTYHRMSQLIDLTVRGALASNTVSSGENEVVWTDAWGSPLRVITKPNGDIVVSSIGSNRMDDDGREDDLTLYRLRGQTDNVDGTYGAP